MIVGCCECEYKRPHSVHIVILNEQAVLMSDDNGNPIEPPSTVGHLCALCGNQVTFIDPEFNNAFCLPCSWMGPL